MAHKQCAWLALALLCVGQAAAEDASACADANAAVCAMITDQAICETGLGPYTSVTIKAACAKTCGVCTTAPPTDAATDAPVETAAAVTTASDASFDPDAVKVCVAAKCITQIASCFGVPACAGVSLSLHFPT